MTIKSVEDVHRELREFVKKMGPNIFLVKIWNVRLDPERGVWHALIKIARGRLNRLLRRYEVYKIEMEKETGNVIVFDEVSSVGKVSENTSRSR